MMVFEMPAKAELGPLQISDFAALRTACQGPAATVLAGDLSLWPIEDILVAMRSVQAGDEALGQLIAGYLAGPGSDKPLQWIYGVGRLVRCAASFLMDELSDNHSPYSVRNWTPLCLSKLNRLLKIISNNGSAQALFALQAAVIKYRT